MGKSTSKSKSGSKSGSRSKSQNHEDWSEWEWDEQYQREWRGRLGSDGEWEYEYRPSRNRTTPRSSASREATASLDHVREEQVNEEQDEESSTPSYTTNRPGIYDANPRPAISSLTHKFGNTSLDSSQYQDDRLGYGAEGESMVGSSSAPLLNTQRSTKGIEGSPDTPATSMPGGFSYAVSPKNEIQQWPSTYSRTAFTSSMPSYTTYDSGEPSGMSMQPKLERIRSPSTESGNRFISGAKETPPHKETPLHKDFKVHLAKEFKFGRVFKILWTEPKGQGMPGNRRTEVEGTFKTNFGEEYYTCIRRFVIVRPDQGHCLCLPILTYQRQGTSKRGVKPQDHAIIFTKKKGKDEKPTEAEGEEKLQNKAIRMEPKTPRDQLDPLSRLNYAKIYTVEYNVKVKFIGDIHKKSQKYFKKAYNLKHQPLPEGDDVDFSEDSDDQEIDNQQNEEQQ